MKLRIIISTLALIAIFNIACDDDADNLGQKIQPTDDEIVIKADTFHLFTETFLVENLVSLPDSFLLGKFEDNKYGTTEANILSELRLSKDGFTFLDEETAVTQVDSLVLTMSLGSVFGSLNSPIHVSVYELNDSLKRKADYMSDLDITPFVDVNKDKLIGETTLSIRNGETEEIATYIRFHMTPEFTQRFFTTNQAHYKNQNAFRDFFHGIYITTDFGHATMLNIRSITLSMYYNYAYKTNLNEKLHGQQDFHVNSEVKSVNQILHPVRGFMPDPTNEFSQVTSPANHYTRIKIPIDRIYDRVKIPGKTLDINSASIKINIKTNESAGQTYLPYVSNMLLIKESSLNRFFSRRESLSDTCAFLATQDSTLVEEKVYDYNYSFSGLSTLIEQEIKKKDKNESSEQYIEMVLVPVTPIYRTYNNSLTLSEIKQSNLLQSSILYGGNNKEKPMKMEIIYSGF